MQANARNEYNVDDSGEMLRSINVSIFPQNG